MTDPIRVFVGADCNNCDLESQAVLEYSIRKHTTRPVEITWMQQAETGPWSGWQTASARTPFTHYRWSIPAVCGYDGRAIYMDSDFLVLSDIGELWDQPFDGVFALRGGKGERVAGEKIKTCCMLIDCARAKGHVPNLAALRGMPDAQSSLTRYFRDRPSLVGTYEGDWNCIDGKGYDDLSDSRLKAVHYSRIETQLHLKHALARLEREGQKHWYTGEVLTHWRTDLIAIFDRFLEEALAAGYTPDRYRVTPFGAYEKKDFVYTTHKGARP
jgi:hypothetical protein